MGLRDLAQELAPPCLSDDSPATADNPSGGVAGRLVYLLGLMGDAMLDKVNQGIYARLPLGGTTSPSGGNGGPDDDALALLGADRVIVRGIGESAKGFGGRLRRAFPTWQHAGQAKTVLQEVLAYLQSACRAAIFADITGGYSEAMPSTEGVAWVTEYGAGADTSLSPARWRTLSRKWWWDTGYGPLQSGVYPGSYMNAYVPHPDALDAAWWRAWLVLWSIAPNAWTGPGYTWGTSGKVWGDTTRSWGLSVPASTIETVRSIVGTWKCAHTWYQWLIVSFEPDFANWRKSGAVYPNTGDWQRTSKIVNGQYVPARDPNLRYCAGIANPGT